MKTEHNTQYKGTIDMPALKKIGSVLDIFEKLNIGYNIWYHPPLPTIEKAISFWKDMPGTHCKNLFFRNHKGDKHYMVIFECSKNLDIHSLEKMLKQGKLSFASEKRMLKYLDVYPGSVTPLALINDTGKHVVLFIDKELADADMLSFHPCDNRASVVLNRTDFFRFLEHCGNKYYLFSE